MHESKDHFKFPRGKTGAGRRRAMGMHMVSARAAGHGHGMGMHDHHGGGGGDMGAQAGIPASEHVEWADWNLDRYRECIQLWAALLSQGRCNYETLLLGSQYLYGACINYKDAGMNNEALICETALRQLNEFIVELMQAPKTAAACAITFAAVEPYLEI